MEIPNLRDKAVRELWRNDTACSDSKTAGDMLLPTFSKGTPEIGAEVYERMKNLWKAECESSEDNYRNAALNQGAKKQTAKRRINITMLIIKFVPSV